VMRGRRPSRLWLAAVAVAAAAVAAGSVAGMARPAERHAQKSKTVLVMTRNLKHLGQVLVDSKGRTLYMFARDKQQKVTCTSASCVAAWPPLKLPTGGKLVAGGEVQRNLLGSDPDPKGGRVVTYDGWPLYRYVADTKPGQDSGQATKLNGGYWYALAPSGKVIKKKP